MTVQDIVNAVSVDTRQVLAASGADANTILNWVDRIHKDVLHSSVYVNQNLASTTITTTVNTNIYNLVPTNIRRIVSVYDLTFQMSLTPSDAELDQPSPTAARVDEQSGRAFSAATAPLPHQAYRLGGTPEYYRFIGTNNTLTIRPAPINANFISNLAITYEQLVPTLTALGTTLTVPDDGKDVVCAGVNWMAMAYIGKPQEAASWFQLYQQLKAGDREGIIR